VEVGPRDLANRQVTVARRDTSSKSALPLEGLDIAVDALLEEIQKSMYERALADRDVRTQDVTSLDEAREAAATGFARLPWRLVGDEDEARLGEEALSVRCIQRPDGTLPETQDEPDLVCLVARAY